jgi:hypothetical protein
LPFSFGGWKWENIKRSAALSSDDGCMRLFAEQLKQASSTLNNSFLSLPAKKKSFLFLEIVPFKEKLEQVPRLHVLTSATGKLQIC